MDRRDGQQSSLNNENSGDSDASDNGDDDSADDDDLSRDPDSAEGSACKTIEFYVGLLMNLIPSLERLCEQNLSSQQNDGHVSKRVLDLPSELPPPYYEDSSKAASSKRLSQDQHVPDTNKLRPLDGTRSSKTVLKKSWTLDLTKRFEKRLRLKGKSSADILSLID